MNETEFGKDVMKRLEADRKLSDWYELNLAHRGFDKTIEKIAFADEINTEQKILLSLFIGLSTELVLGARKNLAAWEELKEIFNRKPEAKQ